MANELFGFDFEKGLQERRDAALGKLSQFGDVAPRSVFDQKPQQFQQLAVPKQLGGEGAQPASPAPAPPALPLIGSQEQPATMPTTEVPQTVAPAQDGLRPLSPAEQARQDEIGAAIGRGDTAESRFQQQRQEEFANKLAEAKSGVGARAVISSLEKEGMTRDEIKQAIGGTEGKGKAQALSELQRLQRTRAKARAEGGIDDAVRSRAVEGARFDTDEGGNQVPKNTEARAKQMLDRGDDLGPDPQSDQSLYESMKPSERRQYDRTVGSMSQGTRNPNAERRLSDLVEKTEKRRDREYLKKQADRESKALTLAAKRAQTAENTAQRKAGEGQVRNWKTELETIDDQYKKANRTEKKRLDTRRQEIFSSIEAFNKGLEIGAEASTEQAGTHQEANDAAKEAGQRTYTFEGEEFVTQ